MKKITAFFAALIAFAGSQHTYAQENKNNSLLWRISGKDLAKPSYLFGTIHMICKDDYLWTDKMKHSLDSSEKVCFEMDLDDQAVLMQVSTGLIDQTGKKLKDYFTAEQYALLEQYLRDTMGMSAMEITLLQQMKPIALQTMISTGSAACPNTVSYEDTLMKIAQKSKKEIIGLEDPKEQIAVLESIPPDTVVKQLMEEIQNKNRKEDTEYNQLVTAYKKQDLTALYNMITASAEMGDDMGLFLDDRNKRWIQRMPSSMRQSSVFFAVGAGHLWGQNGVISLLRKDGYTVEPIK